ncbi:MAG: ParB/RepB/Spo0J family partition protein [Clostridia bacterium]|nr:ParB/RepB/Spo0J family partition protein [Clostridia bacterium]
MSLKKGGLGKGLDALLMENASDSDAQVSLRISDIVPNRNQPRKAFDDDALRELADSIAQHGVLQPLLVRPMTDGSYQLVAGERRWRASRLAGLTEVPVVVREMSEQEASAVALIENLQREDLNPMEEALGFKSLMETYGLTQEETAAVVNKSRPAVTNALRLLTLPAPIATMVTAGKISAGHARAILSFDTEAEMLAAAEQAADKQLSVREVERMAKASHAAPSAEKKKSPVTNYYKEVELALNAAMNRRVKVIPGKTGGVLQIEFYSQDDLRDLANAISPEQ